MEFLLLFLISFLVFGGLALLLVRKLIISIKEDNIN
jgi:hypothetical protein